MAYLGTVPAVGSFEKIDSIRGLQDGTRTTFPLTISNRQYTPEGASQLMVVRNGVTLEPGEDFSVGGSSISITPAPQGNDYIWILTFGEAKFTGVPSAGTVTTEKIADSSIEFNKFSGDTVSTIIGNIITFGI